MFNFRLSAVLDHLKPSKLKTIPSKNMRLLPTQTQPDQGGEIVAVAGGATMKADAVTKALDELDSARDKTVDMVLATKLPALDKKK